MTYRITFTIMAWCLSVACAWAADGKGAFHTGVYRNLLAEKLGLAQQQTDERMRQIWHHFFEHPRHKVYFEDDDHTAYILDTGSNDVRTEGMSYGMMICVQLDKREQFDKLWRWAKRHMRYNAGKWEGYYEWHVTTDGKSLEPDASCASDGEAYFITALFFASRRWGNEGSIHYEQEAQDLIRDIMSKDGSQGIYNMFDAKTGLITFVPNGDGYDYTDPSYNLPAFLEIWAERSHTNRDFWARTPRAARQLLIDSSHPVTGLFPDYSHFDGSPKQPDWKTDYDARRYQYDAIRCAMNIGMDAHWFGTDIERQSKVIDRLLSFFKQDNFTHGQFRLDGTEPTGDYGVGMAGANAVGLFACPDHPLAREYMSRLWDAQLPTGEFRYYTGMVYMLSMLHVTGNFRIW